MRVIRTCILKLLVDTDEPAALRGSLRLIEHDAEEAFRSEAELVARLNRIVREILSKTNRKKP